MCLPQVLKICYSSMERSILIPWYPSCLETFSNAYMAYSSTTFIYDHFLLFWSPVHAVCPNHEILLFQSWTGTPVDLGSVVIITTFIIVSSRPTCFNRVLYLCFHPRTQLLYLPHLSPFVAALLTMLHLLVSPNFLKRGETIHLDSAPTCCPTPLV